MKRRIGLLIAILVLPTLLSACIIAPWDWDDGYYHGGHHHGYHRGDGWYDGRR